jgi:Protein of unknown function (DUF3303)
MLFMVIEYYGEGVLARVGERFRSKGRMLPADVTYLASWLEPSGARCFQLMEAPGESALQPWIDAWSDLVRFEVAAVETSADFWKKRS